MFGNRATDIFSGSAWGERCDDWLPGGRLSECHGRGSTSPSVSTRELPQGVRFEPLREGELLRSAMDIAIWRFLAAGNGWWPNRLWFLVDGCNGCAEAIAEAALRPNLRTVREKTQDQLDLQACHRVRSRLVSRRTATINQIRAFLIEQGIAVRPGARALRNSLFGILKNREDEISPRMSDLIVGLYEDWLWLDERIETVTREIEEISQNEANCRRLMSVPGVGRLISTAMVAAIGTGEAFERGRDFGAWLGLVPRQYSTGGKNADRLAGFNPLPTHVHRHRYDPRFSKKHQ